MKKYIEPTTQITQVQMHAIMSFSVNEGGETTKEGVWGADAPVRILYI